jgi:hypothetical protein
MTIAVVFVELIVSELLNLPVLLDFIETGISKVPDAGSVCVNGIFMVHFPVILKVIISGLAVLFCTRTKVSSRVSPSRLTQTVLVISPPGALKTSKSCPISTHGARRKNTARIKSACFIAELGESESKDKTLQGVDSYKEPTNFYTTSISACCECGVWIIPNNPSMEISSSTAGQ